MPAIAAERQGTALEEVIVTARRRAENIQETPIAVSALSGDDLRERGLGNVQDLAKVVPSLEVMKNRSSAIFIRGVGERTGFARVDPAVGVYLDDLFLPRADGQLLDTVDVSSIQVLRGPQGTLFGKNTTGGAMVMSLLKPSDTVEGYLDVGMGNRGLRRAKASINFPITDHLFMKIAANTIKDDGYIEDELVGTTRGGDNDRQSLITQLRWDISSTMSLDAFAYYGRVNEQIATDHCNVINENSLFMRGLYIMWAGDTDPQNPRAFKENCESNSREVQGDFNTRIGPNPYMKRDLESAVVAGTLQWELSEYHTIKAVMGLRGAEKGPQWLGDNDGGPAKYSESYGVSFLDPDQKSQRDSLSLELQFNGSTQSENLSYTLGLFGMRETNEEPFSLFTALAGLDLENLSKLATSQAPGPTTNPAGTTPMVGTLTPISYSQFGLENITFAAFGQASWHLTDLWEVTAGVRYTSEKRSSDLTVYQSDVDAVSQRLATSGFFGPGAGGFNPFNGTWAGIPGLGDPVTIANSLFPDTNGDGLPDYPFDLANPRYYERSETFSKTTPMGSLSYSFSDGLLDSAGLDSGLFYLTWSFGFKSGFFEPRGIDGLERVEPETVENRELGLKLEALNRSLRVNLAAYSMDFDEMQLIQVKQDSAGNNAVIFQNAGASSIVGGEIEVQWIPVPSLNINFAYSNNNYSYEDYKDADLFTQAIGQGVVLNDRSDEPFQVSPQDNASIGIQYTAETGVGRITPRLDVRYRSERYFGIDNTAYDAYRRDPLASGDEPFTVVDMRLGWENPEGSTAVTLYVNNAFDERYLSNSGGVGDSIGTNTGSLAPPRSYGVDVRWVY
ncbi:outer membrane receptor protein involved in Fe transport [Litorivivens lipolytica]|uniref:Outer membrane receptor protein involved in Fe transport n=1 Tax=Litorivivens lipolytica TaxID=1524264 RepID=A0A7W4W3W1_9GAMM|nr:outer membrane receptor protein involved in Fe transport [Litorivivens lipolytica]